VGSGDAQRIPDRVSILRFRQLLNIHNRTAEGRSIKNLTVVDDATHEAMAIVPERALCGNQIVRILEQLSTTRGVLKEIRTDNRKEFCSRALLTWAHARGVLLFLIEPGKSNQNT
jgi:putative transposase